MDDKNPPNIKTFHCKDLKIREEDNKLVLEMVDYDGNKETRTLDHDQALKVLEQLERQQI